VINFRYHVVSLTAVFLALAIGLVVGTAALNGPAAESLGEQVSDMRKQNETYRDQVNHLKADADRQEQFATEATPYLLGDKLLGRRVVVVTTSDADREYVDGMLQTLSVAGVKVTGRIAIQRKFVEPTSNEELLDLVDLSTQPGITGLPANSNGVETSAALLAAVLLDRTPALTADARRRVVAAYKDGGFVIVTPDVTSPAEAAVVLSGAPYTDRDAPRMNAAFKFLVEQFDRAGPLVVAGNGVGGDGNLVAAVRGDPALAKTVSTVDTVATPQGRAVTALALIEHLTGRSGHYGIGAGATALLPRPPGDRTRNGS
jgi:hypothetical protein